jgi:hypothetical protein
MEIHYSFLLPCFERTKEGDECPKKEENPWKRPRTTTYQ